MRIRLLFPALLVLSALIFSCNSDLDVNDDWKDITVVYGLLDQDDTVHYVKITKAFLGEGNALQYAQIPDSSYYRDTLDVRLEEYLNNVLQPTSFIFETTITSEKDSGLFYYPDQLLYRTQGHLNEEATYKLVIRNRNSGKLVTATTPMVQSFSIDEPQPFDQASYKPGSNSQVKWTSAVGGKRYQLLIRFHYLETLIADTSQHADKYVDWTVFKDLKSEDTQGGRAMSFTIPGEAFYIVVGSQVPESDQYNRLPRDVEYIFTVCGEDMNTYLEVTEPTTGLIQERPPFSNIDNGIGLFSCIYDNRTDDPLVLQLSYKTLQELKTNSHTINRGF